jgi:hypothetical protein
MDTLTQRESKQGREHFVLGSSLYLIDSFVVVVTFVRSMMFIPSTDV